MNETQPTPDGQQTGTQSRTADPLTDPWLHPINAGAIHLEPEQPIHCGPPLTGIRMDPDDVRDPELQQLQATLARVAELAADYPAGLDTALLLEALDQSPINPPSGELQQLRAAIGRVHAELIRLCREPHPSHNHLCPDDIRRTILGALDQPQES